MSFVEVAKVPEIPSEKMKHVEVNGNEILVANVGGTFYAISDRCGHMNARLSTGNLNGTVITCPLHGSRFDVTTGKKVADPVIQGAEGIEGLPEALVKLFQRQMEIVMPVKTYDLPIFPVKVDGESILVDV
jgi:nitrite reductase/ring-hydroxylating ferredoxin subunit